MALCKFFAQGRCTYGASCKNSHEASATLESWRPNLTFPIIESAITITDTAKVSSKSASAQVTNLCWFYSQGKCTYGAACRLSHDAALPDVNPLSARPSRVKPVTAAFLSKKLGVASPVAFVPGALQHVSDSRPPAGLNADVPSFTPSTRVLSDFSAVESNAKDPTCVFFSKGFCRNGEICPFRHEAPTTLPAHTTWEQEEQKTLDLSDNAAQLSIGTSLMQVFHDASVTFEAGAEVSSVKLSSDFSTLQILGLSPDVRASFITGLLAGLGFQVPESNILVKSLGEEGSVAEVKVEDPTFAKAVTRKFESHKEKNTKTNISIKPLARNAATGALANRLQLSTVTCTWYKPSRIASLMYTSRADAMNAKQALGSRKILQRTPTYSIQPGGRRLAVTLLVANLDVATQKRDIYAVLPSSLHPERINFGDPTYPLSDTQASENVEALLQTKGGLESFQWHVLPGNSKIKATATFTDWDEAAEAVRSLNDTPVENLGGTKLFVGHVVSVKYSVPNLIMDAIDSDVDLLRENIWQRGHVHLKRYHSTDPSKPSTAVRVFGENIKLVAEAKGEMERMLAGNVVMDGDLSQWDPYFMSAMSLTYLNDLSRNRKLYIHRDARRRRLLIYGGSSTSRLEVERLLGMKVRALRQLTQTIILTPELLKITMQGGMTRLRGKFSSAVTLNVLANPKTISFIGTMEEFQEAKDLLLKASDQTAAGDGCVICWSEDTEAIHTSCGHVYCKDCFANQASSAGDKDIPLRCHGNEEKCLKIFSISELKTMLSHAAFEELLEASFDTYIRTHPKDFQHCPTLDCPQVYRITTTGQNFLCSTCLASVCTTCNVVAHESMTCEEYKDLSSEGSKAFQKWKKENDVRDCPNCKSAIEKSYGCNHMECRQCSTHICWFCMKNFGTSDECYAHMSKDHGNYFDE